MNNIWLKNETISHVSDSRFQSLTDTEKAQDDRVIALLSIDNIADSKNILKKICELGLMICIVIARWLMPRGALTKDQLSALLLVYVGNSADILELFDTFEEPTVCFIILFLFRILFFLIFGGGVRFSLQ